MKRVDINDEGYHKLIDNEPRLDSWTNYCKWKQSQKMNILDKSGNVRTIYGRFDNYIIHQVKEHFRFFIIEELENQIFQKFRRPFESSKEPEQEKVVKSLLRYKQKQKSYEEFQSSNSISDNNLLAENEDMFKDSGIYSYNSRRYRSRRTIKQFDSELQERMQTKIFETNRNHLGEINIISKNHFSSEGIFTKKAKRFSPRRRTARDKSHLTMMMMKSINHDSELNRRKKRISMFLPKDSTRDKSEGGESVIKKMRINSVERLIHERLDLSMLHKNSKYAIFMLLSIAITNFLSIYLKTPIQKSTSNDIRDHAIAVDVFSWGVWSQVSAIFYMEILRCAREGWIDNTISVYYRDKTIFEYATVEMRLAGAFQVAADNLIDRKVRNISYRSLYNFEDWHSGNVEMIYPDPKDLDKGYRRMEMPRRGALQFIQAYAKRFLPRDYENATEAEIPLFGLPSNREIDKDEEVYRLNLLGDLNRYYTFRSYDYYDYMKGLAGYNLSFIFYSTNFTVLFCALIFTVFFFVIAMEVSRMKQFYKRVLSIKVNSL